MDHLQLAQENWLWLCELSTLHPLLIVRGEAVARETLPHGPPEGAEFRALAAKHTDLLCKE